MVDEETAALLNYSEACYQQSDGLFDVTSGVLRRIWNFKEDVLPTDDQVAATLELIGWNKIIWEKPRVSLPMAGMELDFGGAKSIRERRWSWLQSHLLKEIRYSFQTHFILE